jgi:hypothetical protein
MFYGTLHFSKLQEKLKKNKKVLNKKVSENMNQFAKNNQFYEQKSKKGTKFIFKNPLRSLRHRYGQRDS